MVRLIRTDTQLFLSISAGISKADPAHRTTCGYLGFGSGCKFLPSARYQLDARNQGKLHTSTVFYCTILRFCHLIFMRDAVAI